MEYESQRSEWHEATILMLNAAIETLNFAKEITSIAPAEAVFGLFSVIVTF